jgi:hypothetical protein
MASRPHHAGADGGLTIFRAGTLSLCHTQGSRSVMVLPGGGEIPVLGSITRLKVPIECCARSASNHIVADRLAAVDDALDT